MRRHSIPGAGRRRGVCKVISRPTFANDGVYKSKDWGATWTQVSSAAINALFIDGTAQNVKIAVGTSGNVFVGIENNGQPSGTDLVGLFSSQDGGLTWTKYTLPTTTEACPATFGINPGGQGYIHFSNVTDPNNPKIVYVGGDRQPTPNEIPPAMSCAGPGFPHCQLHRCNGLYGKIVSHV